MQRRLRIAVDAMGGDFAPVETVKGAVQAAREYGTEVILVGHLDAVNEELAKYDTAGLPIRSFHAEEFIPDGGNSIAAIRDKKQASILVANRLVKEGWADAVVGAGHSGACLVASSVVLGRLEGIERPACGACLAIAPNSFVIDLGPNTNCTAEHLFQFAVMGTVYAQTALGIPEPTVAVLSNGAEEGKGNRVSKQAYQLLKDSDLNFIGNVEGHDIVAGKANVIVCDGFTGNILVKFVEGLSQHLVDALAKALDDHWPTVARLPIIEQLRNMVDITAYDGGLLLGVDGVSVLCHGRSDATAIKRTIQRARHAVEQGVVDCVKSALAYELPRVKEALLASGA